MSVTDELWKYADELWKYKYADGGYDNLRLKLKSISNRIDKAVKNEYVKLPKDADGETIHIGDVMDNTHKRGFAAKTVIGISYHEGGKMCVRVDEDELRWHYPIKLHHHHEPTVEDVLREFAQAMNENLGMYTGEVIDADEWRDTDTETIAEYADKLRDVVE